MPEMLDRLCLWWQWLERGECEIRDVEGRIIPLIPNVSQVIVAANLMLQAADCKPLRIVILKARKHGISTLIASLLFFLCAHYERQLAQMLANVASSTDEIFQIPKTIAEHDLMAKVQHDIQAKTREIEFGTHSRYVCHTAGTASNTTGGATVGGTPNLLHLSEFALYGSSKASVEAEGVNAVAYRPETFIGYESTARGRELFWERWCAADTGKSMYAAVFLPWFINPENAIPTDPLTCDQDELDLVMLAQRSYGMPLSDAAIAWRRMKLAELGPLMFKREHPATPEEAVSSAEGLVVPGLRDCLVTEFPWKYDLLGSDDRIGGWDYGYNDPCALINAVVWDGMVWVFDLHRERGLLADDMADARYVLPQHTYYCDPSALGPRQEFAAACRRKGIDATFVPAPRGQGDKAVDQEVDEWDFIRRLIADGLLKIHASVADQLILEADNLFYDPLTGKPRRVRNEACGHFDCLDALRYMLLGARQNHLYSKPLRSQLFRRTTARTQQGDPIPDDDRILSRRDQLRRW